MNSQRQRARMKDHRQRVAVERRVYRSNPRISAAVAAIIGASNAGWVLGDTPANDTSSSSEVQEVVVTAQRRSENLQDVPITIQAVTGDQLKALNVQTFSDLLKYTPNVTTSANGPGMGNIFMRGLSSGGSGNQSQSTTAPFPNVALYLDDQSMQFPGRNNDVYMVDMERVEILEGPQGTLFGGGAQAGAIRYITNKPKLNETSGDFNAGYGITASGGDPNSLGNATLNVPIIQDTLAVRAVVFTDHHGGYISNVPSTIGYGPGTVPAAAGLNPTANNSSEVAANSNPVDYSGARLSALWQMNENWSLLLQQNYQNMQADGYFSEYPIGSSGAALQPYQITAFTPAYDKDHYESTAWTLNGKIGDLLRVVYTGSYMTRHIDQTSDYSNYLRSAVGSIYSCIGGSVSYWQTPKATQCYAPVANWRDQVQNNHQSHELRLSTPEDYRARLLVGAYWEKFVIYDQMAFNYLVVPQCSPQNLATALTGGPDCLSAVGPMPGAFASDPSLRENSNTAFGEDVQRGYRQTAFFISGDFDLIPKVLTVSGGTRFYHYDEFEYGSEYGSESTSPLIINHPNGACTAAGSCGFPINLAKSESGFRSRGNLTWHITPDMMAYFTYSQGFRPGGFNRANSLPGQPPTLVGEAPYIAGDSATKQYNVQAGYNSDNLINNEVGFKSEFLDHRVLLNVSAYLMHWNDIQLALYDPVHLGNSTFNVNGPSYTIKGIEVQFIARVTDGLTVQGSSSSNSSNQTNAPCLVSNRASSTNPTPLGQCITQINGAPYTNPYGVLDTSPAYSPPWQFNLRARYDWSIASYRPFVWVGGTHVSSMRNEPASFPDGNDPSQNPPTTTLLKYTIPGYTTYDAAIGVAKDNWTAQLSGSNIGNSDAVTNITSGQFIKAQIPLRPRVLLFQLGYRF
jgi:iron complex outermembrane receptor protein